MYKNEEREAIIGCFYTFFNIKEFNKLINKDNDLLKGKIIRQDLKLIYNNNNQILIKNYYKYSFKNLYNYYKYENNINNFSLSHSLILNYLINYNYFSNYFKNIKKLFKNIFKSNAIKTYYKYILEN